MVWQSVVQLLRAIGTTGASLQKAVKELAEEAEKANYWLWLQGRVSVWGQTQGKMQGVAGRRP